MKNNFFCLIAILVGIFSSCSNDEIQIDKKISVVNNALTITVDLTNFYSSYTFDDTKHRIDQIAEAYRTFNSNNKMHIQVRTLIYDKASELLVDSIVSYVTNTNSVTESLDLYPGDYYAVTTLAFATQNKRPLWNVIDGEKLSTAKLAPLARESKWSILSESTDEFSVSRGQNAKINTVPKPLGALIYFLLENFQYKDELSYGYDAEDNGIRKIALYSLRKAVSYNLNPNATSKFNYAEETSQDNWYVVKSFVPTNFKDEWTYFQGNMYGYCYILEPEQTTVFGLMREGDTGFSDYGQQKTTYVPGVTYLAYWDYFKVGNPYLGIADNNHWNSYNVVPHETLFEIPYTEWGASKEDVRSYLSSLNYPLVDEGNSYLMYAKMYKESFSIYSFTSSNKLKYVDFYFESDNVPISEIIWFVPRKCNATYYGTSEDGSTIWYLTNDEKSLIGIASVKTADGSTVNIVRYLDNTGASSAKSKVKESLQKKSLEIKCKVNK